MAGSELTEALEVAREHLEWLLAYPSYKRKTKRRNCSPRRVILTFRDLGWEELAENQRKSAYATKLAFLASKWLEVKK